MAALRGEKVCPLVDVGELFRLYPGIVREQLVNQLRGVKEEVLPVADLIADGVVRIVCGNHGNHILVILILLFAEDQRARTLPAAAELKEVVEMQLTGALFAAVHSDPAFSHQAEDTFTLWQFIETKFNLITFFSSHGSPSYSSNQLYGIRFV